MKGNKLKNAEEDPLIADDREKEMQWKGKSGVNFVDLGDDKHRRNTGEKIAGKIIGNMYQYHFGSQS